VGRIGVRDEKAVRSGLVPAHHVRCPGQRHLDHVRPASRRADRSQRVHDAQSAVCDVVRPGRRRPHRPVDAASSPVSRGEVRGHGRYGQIQIARVQRTQPDPGITHEQLEHLIPSLPVEATTNPVQHAVRSGVPANGTQRDRDAGEPEIQRAALKTVRLCAQGIRTQCDSPAVPVIAEVLICLVQGEYHTGQTVVQGQVRRTQRAARPSVVRGSSYC
jgi:hypothetical protein